MTQTCKAFACLIYTVQCKKGDFFGIHCLLKLNAPAKFLTSAFQWSLDLTLKEKGTAIVEYAKNISMFDAENVLKLNCCLP